MHEQGRQRGPEVDPKNGFEIVWKSGPENITKYTLLKVPVTEPIQLIFDKPSHELHFSITPYIDNASLWHLQGIIDPDIAEGFGLPLSKRRNGGVPPVAIFENTVEWRKFGDVDQVADLLYDVNLHLYPTKVNKFLARIWHPTAKSRSLEGNGPRFDIDGSNGLNRILPTKQGGKSQSTLIVERLPKSPALSFNSPLIIDETNLPKFQFKHPIV